LLFSSKGGEHRTNGVLEGYFKLELEHQLLEEEIFVGETGRRRTPIRNQYQEKLLLDRP